MTGVALPGALVAASDDPWPVDLDVAAVELVTALRWQLGRLRLTTLNPDGLIARRRVWAGRNRVFTLISGMPGADPLVIERALQLALGVAPPATATAGATSTTTAELDASLTTAVNLWQAPSRHCGRRSRLTSPGPRRIWPSR